MSRIRDCPASVPAGPRRFGAGAARRRAVSSQLRVSFTPGAWLAYEGRYPPLQVTWRERRALLHCLAGCGLMSVPGFPGLTAGDLRGRRLPGTDTAEQGEEAVTSS